LSRFLLSAIAVTLALGAGPAKPGQPAPATRAQTASAKPSLLFITIDTWRWDYIGVSGARKVQTPTLDRLARGGVYDSEMLTPYPLTTPAHASMFTGLTPLRHRVLDCMSYSLPAGIPTLTEAFKSAGYSTAAFVSGDTLKRRYGLTRGFDTYDDSGMQTRYEDDPMPSSRDGAVTTKAAQGWLKGLRPGAPAFLWVHYFDLHTPYRPRPAYEAKYPKDRYAAQAAFVDDQVASLLAAAGADPARNWRIVVVGDHGEGFGEHGELGHGYGLYRETLSVPFIIHPKPQKPMTYPKPWGLIDLDPTLREWLGLPANPGVDGTSLFRASSAERTLQSLSLLGSFMFNVTPVYGVRKGQTMYMKHALEEFYDVAKDPDQKRDLAGDASRKKELEASRAICSKVFPSQEIQSILNPTLTATQAELESLQGLGYIQGATPKLAEVQRVDLRTVLADFTELQKSRTALKKSGDLKKLKETYDAFVKKYPRAAAIYRAYGRLLLLNKDYEGAFQAFDKAVRLNPNDPDSLLNLGTLHLQLKNNPKAALVLLERSVQLSEAEPIAHLNLGIIYNDVYKDSRKAYPHFKRFIELDPQNPEIGKIRAVVQKMEAAGLGRGESK
jgi:arylsulfatase A-like enzyme/regulator of sirC expression with transglutaminase-like and TPR domain